MPALRAQPLTPLAPPSDVTSILILVQIIAVTPCTLPGHCHKGRRGTACCLVCFLFCNLSVFCWMPIIKPVNGERHDYQL